MADDLKVTIGGDATNLESAASKAGKNVSKEFEKIENPFQDMADKFSTYQGIGQMFGGAAGGMIGAFADAFGGIISGMIDKIKELADYAKMLRRISLSTGLSISEIRKIEAVSDVFGVGVESMAKTFVDFTEKMGTARIRGGEVTNVLAKMGVGLKDIENGTFDHLKAMKMLAESYAAGTDEATLLYYGTQLFGEGFKELLPIIKAGSKAIDDAQRSYYTSEEDTTSALARLGDLMANIGRSFKNIFIDLIGALHIFMENAAEMIDNMMDPGFWNPFETLKEQVAREIRHSPAYMTDEERKQRLVSEYSKFHTPEEIEAYKKELEEQMKGRGKVLSPFGMAPALASQMQQMGGGDIFGAIAATPLDRIVRATEATAEHTRPKAAGDAAPASPTPVAR